MTLSGSTITAFGLEFVPLPPYPEDCQIAWVGTDWKRSSYQSIPMLHVLVNRAVFLIFFEHLGLGRFMASSLVCLVWKCFHLTPHCGRQTVFMAVWDWFFFACPVFIISEDSIFFWFILNISISELFWGTHILDMCVCSYPELTLIIENTGELELRSVYLIKDTSG